jgi:hypothetical protein
MKFSPITPVLVLALSIAVGGCGGRSASSILREPPDDWSQFAGKKVTFEGSAGNSPRGPLLRLEDGSVVGLGNFNFWPVTIVSRPVGIVGTVAPGQGARRQEYVINVERWYLVKQPIETSGRQQGPVIEETPEQQKLKQ